MSAEHLEAGVVSVRPAVFRPQPRSAPTVSEIADLVRCLAREEHARRASVLMLGLCVKPGLAWNARLRGDGPWMEIGPSHGPGRRCRPRPVPVSVFREVSVWEEGAALQLSPLDFRKAFSRARQEAGHPHLVPSDFRNFMIVSLARFEGDHGQPWIEQDYLRFWLDLAPRN
jgi:hypothetical protein